ncbi:MAG: metal ABC transporter substrate-binding protein [Chloroflexota bacterium]|nr:MAG: metal ABC transporter substrate-binding protein [Chloroflexota bacterium]
MKSIKLWLSLSLLLVLPLLLNACAFGPQAAPEKKLKLGLLPILDVLPFYIAQDKGYFEAEGLQVELVPVKSAQERDALIQAGEIDGQLNDLISTVLLDREQAQVKIVAKARKAYPDFPQFRIVAAPGVTVSSPADLANVPIGISQNSVIEYMNDRLLVDWGLPADQIAIEEVSAIPTRFELLMNGQLKAALLPDPMGQAAIAGGASLVIDDTKIPEYSQSVLSFSTTALENKPEAVRAFLRAWNKAVADLNKDPNAYRNVLVEKTRVPESIQGTYNVPPFPENEITSQDEWDDVVKWAQDKGLIEQPVAYDTAVDKSFMQ